MAPGSKPTPRIRSPNRSSPTWGCSIRSWQSWRRWPALAASITRRWSIAASGGWRTKTAWDLLDAALDGQTAEALVQLDRLLLAGEAPIALLGQVAATLAPLCGGRAIGRASRSCRPSARVCGTALEQAGVKPFVIAKSEGQLRRLGRARAGRAFHWLLEADLALKGDELVAGPWPLAAGRVRGAAIGAGAGKHGRTTGVTCWSETVRS